MNSTMDATSPPNPMYARFGQTGYPAPLVWLYSGVGVLQTAGIGLNCCLLFATAKCKSLHGYGNLLIALYALSVSFILGAFTVKPVLLRLGINFVPLSRCYAIQTVPLFVGFFASSSQAFIGLERLICVLFPIWYKFNGKMLLISISTFCLLVASACSYLLYSTFTGTPDPDKPVSCAVADVYSLSGRIGQILSIKTTIFYAMEFVCYALIWLTLIFKKSQATKNKQLTRSLCALLSVSLCCYLLALVWSQFVFANIHIAHLDDPLNVEYFAMMPTYYLYAIACSSCTPMLLSFSKEYRNAFRKCFTKSASTNIGIIFVNNHRVQQNGNTNGVSLVNNNGHLTRNALAQQNGMR